jgi:hypothetical protein
VTGIVDFRTELLDETGAPITASNPLPTTGGGGGGGGTLSDTVFVDSTGQLFVYRDTGTGTPNAYAIPAWTLYTPVGAVTSASAGNAAASATGSAVPGSADYVGFNSSGNLVGVSATTPLPTSDVTAEETRQDMVLLLVRMLNYLNAPMGYDKSLQRQRGTVVVESGTVTAVTTVTTVTTVGTVTTLSNIDGYNARMQILDQNRVAWAQCVRARIT